MKDVNFPLRKAYISKLTNLTYLGVVIPVYYQFIPDDKQDPAYIIISPVITIDTSAKTNNDSQTSFRVGVYTRSEKYNDGKACDLITGLILAAIYPNPSATMDLSADGLQNVNINLAGDQTQSWKIDNQKVYITRILTFRHTIFHLS